MLFTVGSIDEIKIIDAASGRRLCSTHSPVWDSLLEAADWRDEYQPTKDLFTVFAVWDGDTRIVSGADYRQTLEPFNAVHIDTELPDWMYMYCDVLADSITDGCPEISGDALRKRIRIMALDAVLRFDFLI